MSKADATPVVARYSRLLAFPALLLAMAALGAAQDEQAPASRSLGQSTAEAIPGETLPSKEMDLAFPLLGHVSEVLVKEGDVVEAGQVLMKQDIAADMARLQGLEAKADVKVLVALAGRQKELAELELEAAKNALTAMSDLEVRRAELEVTIADTRIDEQRRQGKIDEFGAAEQRIMIDEKQMKSPDSGIVQKVDASVGEVFGPQTPALRIVKIDPLHVEVIQALASMVMRMKVGDIVQVRYDDEDQWRDAKVTFIDPVGNPSGGTGRLRFKAELPNPENLPAGLSVKVRLPTGGRGAEASAGEASAGTAGR